MRQFTFFLSNEKFDAQTTHTTNAQLTNKLQLIVVDNGKIIGGSNRSDIRDNICDNFDCIGSLNFIPNDGKNAFFFE